MADIGRPRIYTPELAQAVCARLSAGESLRQLCTDPDMPSVATVLRWARDNAEFNALYRSAREDLLEHWAEEIQTISDDGSNDWMERETERGRIVRTVDHEHVNRSRLRVDTRKWLLSKLAPRKYGDKLELSGPGGGPLQQVSTVLSKEDFRELAGDLVGKV